MKMPTGYRSILALAMVTAAMAALPSSAKDDAATNENWREMDVPAAPALDPDEAMKTFRTAPGFRLELVAAEPWVEDPVTMTWDADGRIWAVEMRGYMPDAYGKGEDVRNGQIVVLEDTNADGKMDKSTVFLGELQMPRAVAVVEETATTKGVLVAEPPNLWYCRDTDGDLKCDEKVKLADYARQGPVEHTDNGLMLALDNWMYNAKSQRRFRFADGKLIEEETSFRGQWGIAQDDHGRLYHNHNSTYLVTDRLPFPFQPRSAHSKALRSSERVANTGAVHSIRVNPGVNRGYRGGTLREDGRLRSVTAVSGLTIYRGDQFDAAHRGNAFVPEPGGNVVARFTMHYDGLNVRGEQETVEDARWGERAFVASTDERFRPVEAFNGPDGCLYLVDLYRGILQHRVYVTPYLRKQILERGLDKPLGMGRIYRVVQEGREHRTEPPMLTQRSSRELVGLLSHANGWHRSTAQRLLVQRREASVDEALRSLAINGREPLGRLHALWTLEGTGGLDAATALAATGDEDAAVRAAALRLAAALLSETPHAPLTRAVIEAMGDDDAVAAAAAVATAAALDDGVARRAVMQRIAEGELREEALALAVDGLTGKPMETLREIMESGAWTQRGNGRDDVLRTLAATIAQAREAGAIAQLLAMAAAQDETTGWRRSALMSGVRDVARGWKGEAVTFAARPAALTALEASKDKTVQEAVRLLEEKTSWPERAAPAKAVAELTPEQHARVQQGKVLYLASCMACHQLHGEGQAGMAPSLVDSEYVLGSPQRLTRIVLQGLQGPIVVNDEEWNLVMPGHLANPMFGNDEAVAGLLTYIRREWGHEGSAVSPATVGAVRKATQGREEPWTAEELEKFE